MCLNIVANTWNVIIITTEVEQLFFFYSINIHFLFPVSKFSDSNLVYLMSVSSLLGHEWRVSLLGREVFPFSPTSTMALGPQWETNILPIWETMWSVPHTNHWIPGDCAEVCYHTLYMQHQESLGIARTLTFNFTFVLEIVSIQKTWNFSKNKRLIHKCDGWGGG